MARKSGYTFCNVIQGVVDTWIWPCWRSFHLPVSKYGFDHIRTPLCVITMLVDIVLVVLSQPHWLTIARSSYWWFWFALCWFGLKEHWCLLWLIRGCWNMNLPVLVVNSFVVSSEDSHKSILILCIRFCLINCWDTNYLGLKRVVNACCSWCRDLMIHDSLCWQLVNSPTYRPGWCSQTLFVRLD